MRSVIFILITKYRLAMQLLKLIKMMVGPASSITGAFILNSILVEVANLLKNEKIFPFYISVNMPGAKENNDKLVKKYKKSNPHL